MEKKRTSDVLDDDVSIIDDVTPIIDKYDIGSQSLTTELNRHPNEKQNPGVTSLDSTNNRNRTDRPVRSRRPPKRYADFVT